MNAQQSNQFLNYQNYHHDQLMHQQYFDENPHVQNYNFVPYANESFATPAASAQSNDTAHQENFTSVQTNELYEFLPEEIFQLDQPILKTESQLFSTVGNVSSTFCNMDPLQTPYTSPSSVSNPNSSHCFLDLSSGQIQTNMKYPTQGGFSSEINNNSNFQPGSDVESVLSQLKPLEMNTYSFQSETSSRFTCAVENEKMLKRKHLEIGTVMKHNILSQSYHLNQQLFAKRENSCLLQPNTSSFFPPEMYTTFQSKSSEVYQTMDKYNNYITNN